MLLGSCRSSFVRVAMLELWACTNRQMMRRAFHGKSPKHTSPGSQQRTIVTQHGSARGLSQDIVGVDVAMAYVTCVEVPQSPCDSVHNAHRLHDVAPFGPRIIRRHVPGRRTGRSGAWMPAEEGQSPAESAGLV